MLRGTPYEGGRNWPKVTLTQGKETDAAEAAGNAIIQMLGDNLGMKVEYEVGDLPEVYQRMFQGKIQLMWVRWYVDYPDPNDVENLIFYGKTAGGHRQTWHDDQYDEIVTRAVGEPDPHRRAALYQQADEIIARQAAAVFVFYPYSFGLIKPHVQGLPRNKAGAFVPDWNIFNRMRLSLSIAEH
jgi:oligopeptide transport system substrate-binding protein